jgi:hypothetical protein
MLCVQLLNPWLEQCFQKHFNVTNSSNEINENATDSGYIPDDFDAVFTSAPCDSQNNMPEVCKYR